MDNLIREFDILGIQSEVEMGFKLIIPPEGIEFHEVFSEAEEYQRILLWNDSKKMKVLSTKGNAWFAREYSTNEIGNNIIINAQFIFSDGSTMHINGESEYTLTIKYMLPDKSKYQKILNRLKYRGGSIIDVLLEVYEQYCMVSW